MINMNNDDDMWLWLGIITGSIISFIIIIVALVLIQKGVI